MKRTLLLLFTLVALALSFFFLEEKKKISRKFPFGKLT
ncbi:hypothetical protein LEP1GSC043_0910 [Leptospira weilii str. Ecochallenge]|uniref:Uncharacterized protein n=1 Tax=Leptospira weilii str. Ecochallenge TaxID=1049986 RepID=N1UE07_9LEPT|nr:hypothetical protein LEP1GSC043_0910 [Leptospira weilii str. Ecochallenge]